MVHMERKEGVRECCCCDCAKGDNYLDVFVGPIKVDEK